MSKPKRSRVWKLIAACGLALFIIPAASFAQAQSAKFVAPATSSHWGRSDLRAYLNGGLTDGAVKNYLTVSNAAGGPDSTYEKNHFLTPELNRIIPSEVNTIDYQSQTAYKTTDRFFLPSANTGVNALEPNKNYAYSLYWGADDITQQNGSSAVAADKLENDRNRFIPKSFIPYGSNSTYVWTRSNGGDSSAIISRLSVNGVTASSVTSSASVAPLLRLKVDDIAFAAAVSAESPGNSQFAIEYNYAGMVSGEYRNINYGMHLKKLDPAPFAVKNVSYSSIDKKLYIEYTGGVAGKYLTFLAYANAANYNIKAYTAVYGLTQTSGEVAIPVNSWDLTSLENISFAAWMETPAGVNDAFASATAPYTNIKNADRKLFALKSELQCSWGDLTALSADKLLNTVDSQYLMGSNPTLQRIYFGVVNKESNTKMQFWIAGRENASGLLSSAGDTLILYQTRGYYLTYFNSTTAKYTAGDVSVTLPSGTGYTIADLNGTTISGVRNVLYDTSFTFRLNRSEGYDLDENITVKANDTVLTGNDGVYTIPSVKENIQITVADLTINSYAVNIVEGGCIFTDTENIPLTGPQTVIHGGTFKFKVQRKPGYDADPYFDVLLDGAIILPDGLGVYTIQNIKKPFELSIGGLDINKYTVTIPKGSGYEVRDEFGAPFDVPTFAPYGTDFKFTVLLSPEFNRNTDINVTTGGLRLTPLNGIYSIPNITKGVSIEISGLTVNNYVINFDPGAGAIINNESGQPLTYPLSIVHGGSLKFKIARKEGYEFDTDIAVMANGIRLTPTAEVYSIPAIYDDYFISIEELSLNQYVVTFPATPYYYVADAFGTPYPQPARASHGNDLVFKLIRMPGYDQDQDITVKTNGVLLTSSGGLYTITAVKSNQLVTIEGLTINRYSITFTPAEGSVVTNTLGGDLQGVEYADWRTDFSFKIKLLPGYEMNADKLAVFADGIKLTADVQGIYTLRNITSNIQISVSDITINTYSVTFPVDPGFVIMDDKGKTLEQHSVYKYGVTLIFKVVRNPGYDQSTDITVNVNGIRIYPGTDDYYNAGKVLEDKIITVTGMKVNTYTVIVSSGIGYTITDIANVPLGASLKINYGQVLSFKVLRKPGYDRDTQITVNANDVVVQATDNVYSLTVNADIELSVSDLSINIYTVTFKNGVGFTVVSHENEPLSSPLSITHGQYFEIKLKRHEGYENDVAVVKNNGSALTPNAVGAYVFQSLDRDLNLTINDLKLNTYTVTFSTFVGYFYVDFANKQHPAVVMVTHGDTVGFKVLREAGYDKDPYITVKSNDVILTPNVENEYRLTNISANVILTVSDLAKNTYVIKYDANGGTGVIPDQAGIVHNELAAINSGELFKNGKLVLAGWATTPNGPVVYAAGTTSFKPIIEDMTLYAVWEKPNQDWILALAIASGVALLILIFVIVYVKRKKA